MQCGIYTHHVLQIKEVPNLAKEELLNRALKQSLARIVNLPEDQCLTFASANSGGHSSQSSKFTQELDKAGVKRALSNFSPTFQSLKTTRRRRAKHEAEIGHVEERPKVAKKSVRKAKNRRQNWVQTTPSFKQNSTIRPSASSLPSQHSSSVADPTHTEALDGVSDDNMPLAHFRCYSADALKEEPNGSGSLPHVVQSKNTCDFSNDHQSAGLLHLAVRLSRPPSRSTAVSAEQNVQQEESSETFESNNKKNISANSLSLESAVPNLLESFHEVDITVPLEAIVPDIPSLSSNLAESEDKSVESTCSKSVSRRSSRIASMPQSGTPFIDADLDLVWKLMEQDSDSERNSQCLESKSFPKLDPTDISGNVLYMLATSGKSANSA